MKEKLPLVFVNLLLITSCAPSPPVSENMGPLYRAVPTSTPTGTPTPPPEATPTLIATPTPQLFDEALRPLFDKSKKVYTDYLSSYLRFYPPSVSPIIIDRSKTDPDNDTFIKMFEALEPQDSLELPKDFFNWPIYGPIWTYFGRGHLGIDIGGPHGNMVYPAAGGIVVFQEKLAYSYGYNIWVNHDNRFLSHYSHLSEFSVKVGDDVIQGQVIGKIGVTGKSTGPHLDFQMVARTNKGWYYIDPLLVLP